ncbi:MAG: hypothetical protein ACXVB9_20045 [Bdellovibrionota bacterium]
MEQSTRQITISIPELILVAGTRALAGFGLGLLLAERMNLSQRRAIGWTLLGMGALSTIPLAFEVFGGRRISESQKQIEKDAITENAA